MKNIIIPMVLLCLFSNAYAENKEDLKTLKKRIELLSKESQPFNLHSLDIPYAYTINVEKENIDDKTKPLAMYHYSGKGIIEYKPSSIQGGSVKQFSYIKECHQNNGNKVPTCYGDSVSTGVNYLIKTRQSGENNYDIIFKLELNDLVDMKQNKIDDFITQQVEINKIFVDNFVTYKLHKETYIFNAYNSNKLSKDNYIITLTLEPIPQ
jgi:hypothetical protein